MSRVLVLNATYEPLAVIPLKRAVVLVLAEKADPIEGSGELMRSAQIQLEAPTVIRLRTMVRVPYRRAVTVNRRNVCARYGHVCAYCGGRATTVDHVVPRAHGGENRWSNVVAACSPCNFRKADKTPAQAKMPLLYTPKEPVGTVAIVLAYGQYDEAWEQYLAPA